MSISICLVFHFVDELVCMSLAGYMTFLLDNLLYYHDV